MRKYRIFAFLLVLTAGFAVLPSAICAQFPVKDLKPTVILISLDGFRWDFWDKYRPPTLTALASKGVRAKWMIPSFPTKTFPNHYTIATGLYPEHHGIIENNILDFGEVFRMSKTEEVQNPRWWLGEPIWVTAEKQGQHAAAYFFPGTETKIEGVFPSSYRSYNGKVPNDMRVDKILAQLDQPADVRPTLLTLYFSDTDDTGHEFGPESEETRYAALNVDHSIKRLFDGLSARRINDRVNLIVVSDHGMAPVEPGKVVLMDTVLTRDMLERESLTTGEIWQIFPKADRVDDVMTALGTLQHTTCWRKKDIPERLNYQDSQRIAPVICSSDLGWEMTTQKNHNDDMSKPNYQQIHGAHGYDNRYQEMMATFIARGPAFRTGYVAEPFSNVEVYNIMCRILGLKPAKNDGDLGHVSGMLR